MVSVLSEATLPGDPGLDLLFLCGAWREAWAVVESELPPPSKDRRAPPQGHERPRPPTVLPLLTVLVRLACVQDRDGGRPPLAGRPWLPTRRSPDGKTTGSPVNGHEPKVLISRLDWAVRVRGAGVAAVGTFPFP